MLAKDELLTVHRALPCLPILVLKNHLLKYLGYSMEQPLPWLLDDAPTLFPELDTATPEGLLAAGGDLSPERLIAAYQCGVFPWFNEGEPILWWSPDPRLVIDTGAVHISRSLQKTLRQNRFTITFDRAFTDVMTACAAPRPSEQNTWINYDMITAYADLHQQGFAHSVECWQGEQLVGGLYGIAIGSMFFGESMFSRQSDSSKVAFVHLCQQLSQCGFPLIDCQVSSPHLIRLGAENISRQDFIAKMTLLSQIQPINTPWENCNG